MPDRMAEDMTDRMPEDMPDRISNRMPNRMPEDLPDRMSDGWIPTGQKRCPKMQKLVPDWPDWVPTGSRLGPDWIPTRFLQKNTYFLKFEHLFLKF